MSLEKFNLHDINNNIITDTKIINMESRISMNRLVARLKEFFIKSINYALENNKKDLQNITNGINELNITGNGNGNGDIVISNVKQTVNINVKISNNEIKLKIINDIIFDLNISLFNFFNDVYINFMRKNLTPDLITTINTINYIYKTYNIKLDTITKYFIMKEQIDVNIPNSKINDYLKTNYNVNNTINLPYNMLNDIDKMINFDIMGMAINIINSNGSISNINQTPIMGDIVSKMFNKTIDDSIIINFINGYKQNVNYVLSQIINKDDKIIFYLNSLLSLIIIDNYIEPVIVNNIVPVSNNNNTIYIIIGISSCIILCFLFLIMIYNL